MPVTVSADSAANAAAVCKPAVNITNADKVLNALEMTIEGTGSVRPVARSAKNRHCSTQAASSANLCGLS